MLANWVKQAVTAGGTGNLTLGSADAGFIDLNTAIGLGLRFPYLIQDGNNREYGFGYLSATSTLVREAVVETLSNGVYIGAAASPLFVSTAAKVMIAQSAGQAMNAPPRSVAIFSGDSYVLNALCGASASTSLIQAGYMEISSFWLPFRSRVSGLGIEVTTAAAASAAVGGIYQVEPSGSLKKIAQIATPYSTATTGIKTSSFASAVVLQPGIYVSALSAQSTIYLRSDAGGALGAMGAGSGPTSGLGLARQSILYGYSATMPDEIAAAFFSAFAGSPIRQWMIRE